MGRRVRPDMTPARTCIALIIAVGVLASATACASDTTAQRTDHPAGRPTATDSAHWPGTCNERVGEARDYAIDATGYRSRDQALLAEAPGPGYRLERVPPAAHRRAGWWIVDIATDEIYAQASVLHGEGGWLVDELERCARGR
jgi:hypothetical protein